MALTFPQNPTNNQVYGQYIFDSTSGTWKIYDNEYGLINVLATKANLTGGNTFSGNQIIASGNIQVPGQPSFRAYLHQLGSNPTGSLTFNTVEHNIGGHFNSSNGRFTAPITGRYLMSFHGFRQDGQSGNWVVEYFINGSVRQSRSYDDSDSSTGYGPNTSIVDVFSLSAGDYVTVNVTSGNLHGNDNCFFSGHFLG